MTNIHNMNVYSYSQCECYFISLWPYGWEYTHYSHLTHFPCGSGSHWQVRSY